MGPTGPAGRPVPIRPSLLALRQSVLLPQIRLMDLPWRRNQLADIQKQD